MKALQDGMLLFQRHSNLPPFLLCGCMREGHSEAVRYFCKAGVPAIFLGGGGYTLGNVPRCWAKETGYILGVDLDPSALLPRPSRLYYFAVSLWFAANSSPVLPGAAVKSCIGTSCYC